MVLVIFFAPALIMYEGDVTIDTPTGCGLIGLMAPRSTAASQAPMIAAVLRPVDAGDGTTMGEVEVNEKDDEAVSPLAKTGHVVRLQRRPMAQARVSQHNERIYEQTPRIEGIIGPAVPGAPRTEGTAATAYMRLVAKKGGDDVEGTAVIRKRPERSNPLPYSDTIDRIAREHGVSPALAAAIIKVESGFKPRAVSRRGARGLMQLLPATASKVGIKGDIYDPERNIRAGVRYLKMMLDRYGGDNHLAVAAYNAGPGAVDRFNNVPPYRETRRYVPTVMQYYRQYSEYFQDI